MKLTSVKNKIVQNVAAPGLITGAIEYEIKQGTSKAEWTGPKIPAPVWHEILAFFKAVFDFSKSECQVRLYVNTVTKTWAAWAYPQEAKTGMSAREITNADSATQREQFKESEGWHYLGTVHHHCSSSAFQSHVDMNNERSQDGLHITIGKLDEKQYDIHARFYLDGAEFIPDMSAFWEIGDDVKRFVPAAVYDTVARYQMTLPPPAETTYPDQWKDNLIDLKPVVVHTVYNPSEHGTPYFNGGNGSRAATVPGNETAGASGATGNGAGWDGIPEVKRKENALAQVRKKAKKAHVKPEELDTLFAFLNSDVCVKLIREAAINHRVSFFDVMAEWQWDTDLKATTGMENYEGSWS